ncbi:MAG: hypothetical protein N3B13_09680, partial [Deltaproteobacteria bacterium]|nr:hypothetical protein [Deltaproteobacteria bacterium]
MKNSLKSIITVVGVLALLFFLIHGCDNSSGDTASGDTGTSGDTSTGQDTSSGDTGQTETVVHKSGESITS